MCPPEVTSEQMLIMRCWFQERRREKRAYTSTSETQQFTLHRLVLKIYDFTGTVSKSAENNSHSARWGTPSVFCLPSNCSQCITRPLLSIILQHLWITYISVTTLFCSSNSFCHVFHKGVVTLHKCPHFRVRWNTWHLKEGHCVTIFCASVFYICLCG